MNLGEKRYITEKEVARNRDISVKWVQNMRYRYSDFPHYKLNGRVYFLQDEVDKWIKKHMHVMGRI